MIAQPKQSERYRYERKFHITEMGRGHVESLVRMNPALFSEIYYRRWVNSIYLDTWSMVSYHENLVGSGHDRIKYRIRWYGDMFGRVENPVLELKIKHGEVNRKEAYPLAPLAFKENFSAQEIYDLFRSADIPDDLRDGLLKLQPVLANRYSRNYFLSLDGRFRATIDSDLTFYDASDQCRRVQFRWFDPHSVVLELKYPLDAAPDANQISQHFPFRLTRNSKYITGVEQVRCR